MRIYAPVIALLFWVALIVLFCRPPGCNCHWYCGWLKPAGLVFVAVAVFLHTKEMIDIHGRR